MQVAVIGGRRKEMGGFWNYRAHRLIKDIISWRLVSYKPDLLFTGMSLGPGQWAAECCIKLKIPFVACLPFKGQEYRWSLSLQQNYRRLLKKAIKVVEVDRELDFISHLQPPGVYYAMKMTNRYRWMINQLKENDTVFAFSQGVMLDRMVYYKKITKDNPAKIQLVALYPEIILGKMKNE